MNLINRFHIDRIIKTDKTKIELTQSLKKFGNRKIEFENEKILISGKAFYDYVCSLSETKIKLTAKPKKSLLIIALIFLSIWTIGFTIEHGILFGLPTTVFIIFFFGFVHRKLMESSLDEITELIKKTE